MASIDDAADVCIELEQRAALSQVAKQLGKKELVPKGCCYGCGEDFVIAGQPAPFFASLGYSLEQLQATVFCPNSADECNGYYQVEKKHSQIRGRA